MPDPDFTIIDDAILEFRTGKYGIQISKKARTDWFEFSYRSVEWKKEPYTLMLEIFPDLDEKGNAISWNLSLIIYKDTDTIRSAFRESFVTMGTSSEVEANFGRVLNSSYRAYETDVIDQLRFEPVNLGK